MITKYQRNVYTATTQIQHDEDGGRARVRLALGEDALGSILDALADQRDPTGQGPSPLEARLQTHFNNLQGFNAEQRSKA